MGHKITILQKLLFVTHSKLLSMVKANFYNKKKVDYINMLSSGKSKRNSKGNIIKNADYQSTKKEIARIEPSKNWFANTKIITQDELEEYRNNIRLKTPYEVLISSGNVPYSLINNDVKFKRRLDYTNAFGERKNDKKPRLSYKTIEELANKAKAANLKKHNDKADFDKIKGEDQDMLNKIGQSKRTWNELYKVLDSSDVVIHVLDARNPAETKCNQVEKYISEKGRHKHMIYILNKADLVPTKIIIEWQKLLSKSHPTIVCHSNSLNHNYGKENLLNVIRQLKTLYRKRTMSIGFVGYPNIGKSSLINILKNKQVCKVAPIPGETKVWQYITLMKDVYLIDSPGVVPINNLKEAVLHGAVRVENLADPDFYVAEIFNRAGFNEIKKLYCINFENIDDFFIEFAKKYKKLHAGGQPNINLISKIIIHDWNRGKIPYYTRISKTEQV